MTGLNYWPDLRSALSAITKHMHIHVVSKYTYTCMHIIIILHDSTYMYVYMYAYRNWSLHEVNSQLASIEHLILNFFYKPGFKL